MAREFARGFYNTGAWKNCAAAYKKYRRGLCEKCLAKGIYKAGVIVHHKTHLTPENINIPSISCGWSNLELLCRDCHTEEHENERHHPSARTRRYRFDKDGRCLIAPPSRKNA